MTAILRFDVRIPVRSPFLFASLDASGLGLDSTALRNRSGRPLIPGDHVRGHLSHAIRAICRTDPALDGVHADLFGVESAPRRPGGEVQDLPRRGRIDVTDFVARADYAKSDDDRAGTARLPRIGTVASVRVEIDERSGAAADGKLQFIELVVPPGGIVTFEGTIRVRAEEARAATIERLLTDALRLIPAMGGSKSVGFGALVSEKIVVARKPDAAAAPARPADADRLEVTVAFDRPILVDGWSNAANLFRGSTVIPGGAIKGALATLLSTRPDGIADGAEGVALSKIRFSHGFPIVSTADGEVLGDRSVPMSLAATVDDRNTVHFADTFDPAAVDRLLALSSSGVAYPGDWKGVVWNAVRERLHRPEAGLRRDARGRVAISETGLAETGKLFVVAPVETSGQRWRFVVDRGDADAEVFHRVLDLLAAGLPGIGRTGARLEVVAWSSAAAAVPKKSTLRGSGEVWVVRLETGAMLTDPTSSLAPADQYEAAFRALAGSPDVELVTHFAQRRTIGGYLAHRYRRTEGRYVTADLTLPGSVFVLKGAGAVDFLAGATRRGLGAVHFPRGAAEIVTDWRISPFVPENGWGEITVTEVRSDTVSVADATAEGV